MLDRRKVLEDAPSALNKVDQPWEVTIEGNSIVARWKWMDATFFGPGGVSKEIKNYTFIVTLDEKGEWEELDKIKEKALGTGSNAGKSGFGVSYNTFKGKTSQKSFELGLGKDNKTGEIGLVKSKFDTEMVKQPIRVYLTACGWKKAGLFKVKEKNQVSNQNSSMGGGTYVPSQDSGRDGGTYVSSQDSAVGGGSYVSNQKPTPTPKRSSNTVLIVVAILAVCCIGGGLVLFFGGILTLDFMAGPQYTNETVGNYMFKIPVGYERTNAPKYAEFRNGTNFIRISYWDSVSQPNLYEFALLVSSEFGGIEGNRVDINGTPAYKFNTQDISTEQPAYSYAINIRGYNYLVSINSDISDPEELLANITSTY